MQYSDILENVARELNLPRKVVDKTYKAFWQFIRNTIQELPFNKELTEQEFNELRTNFNIPSLGKLSCDYDRYINVRNRYKILQHKDGNKD